MGGGQGEKRPQILGCYTANPTGQGSQSRLMKAAVVDGMAFTCIHIFSSRWFFFLNLGIRTFYFKDINYCPILM